MTKTQRVNPDYNPILPRATRLLRYLRATVEAHSNQQYTYEDLAKLTGQAKSTLGNWLNGDGEPSVETMLILWELVPQAERSRILETPIFRCYPTLEHRRISHNPIAVSVIKRLLTRRKGLTIVRGERDDLVTFVVTAFGHGLTSLLKPPYKLCGYDSHVPDWFVPVNGVMYQVASEKNSVALSCLDKSREQWVIMNGIPWMDRAAGLARANHVIFGEHSTVPRTVFPKCASPIHVVSVTSRRSSKKAIQLTVHEILSS